MSTRQHKSKGPKSVDVAILTVSTTRSLAEDSSGHWMRKQALKEGHRVVCHRVVPDSKEIIAQTVLEIVDFLAPQILIVTGGTGVAESDLTIETIQPMMSKELTAFSAIFAQLSFEQIDSAAIVSRAAAGLVRRTVVFCLPGSLNACKLACAELIFPEARHLAAHLVEG